MLYRKLTLRTEDGLEVGNTPMLVPSVSSKLNIKLKELIETISGRTGISGSLLVSAYDYDVLKELNLNFPSLLFLDSGGYECDKDQDVSDIGLYCHAPREWTTEKYRTVIDGWKPKVPTVLISYDHPDVRMKTSKQIEAAKGLFEGKEEFIKELLIKPETKDSYRIHPEHIHDNIRLLRGFSIIGFTEKELGYSVLERMITIAKIRNILDESDIKVPIHIFGSLDPVTTPLYFFAGADIFDGLSWLRFTFSDGDTMYTDSYGPKKFDPSTNYRKIWGQSVAQNVTYLTKMELAMSKFATRHDFSLFGTNSEFFSKTYDDFKEKVGDD